MGRQRRAAHFWRVFSVTAWAMMLTMLGWEMPCMMDASRGSPSLMMIAAKSSMTCSKQTAVRPLVQGTEQASGVFAGPQQWPPKGDQAELPTVQQFGCKTPASHHSSSRGDAAADALQHREQLQACHLSAASYQRALRARLVPHPVPTCFQRQMDTRPL